MNGVNVYVTYETNYIIDDVHFDVNIYLLITGHLSTEINLNKEIKTFNVFVNAYLRQRKVCRKFFDSLR